MRAVASVATLLALAALAGCGRSKHATAPPPSGATGTAPTSTASGTTTGPSALQAEATAAAAGDIPDNQVFLTFHDAAAGYSMKYPEGWAQRGARGALTFRDKNNIVRVVVA